MDGEHYADPLREALGRAAGRTAQLTSLLAVATQAAADIQRRQAQIAHTRDLAAKRALQQQVHAVRQAARSRWAPAHDTRWLNQADLLDVGRVWSAAVPHAAHDPTAEAAVRKCEERLRRLHPHAMAHYDRLRADGLDRLEAMHRAAPSFSRDARDPAPHRAALTPGEGHQAVFDHFPHGPSRDDWERHRWKRAAEQRARELLDEMEACPGDTAPRDEELRSALESRTNLPIQAIDAAVAERARTAAALAALDHPHTITQTVNTASTTTAIDQAPAAARPRELNTQTATHTTS